MTAKNIFDDIPSELSEELFTTILQADGLRIERIVSHGHSSPEGHWCNQDVSEWVILLEGNAGVLFDGDTDPIELKPGSYLNIPAHKRHRVAWTDPNQRTVWLAIYY